jgi:hypothetical protein
MDPTRAQLEAINTVLVHTREAEIQLLRTAAAAARAELARVCRRNERLEHYASYLEDLSTDSRARAARWSRGYRRLLGFCFSRGYPVPCRQELFCATDSTDSESG